MQNRCRFLVRIFAVSFALIASAVFFAGCGDDGNGNSTIFFDANGASGAGPNPIVANAGSNATIPGPAGLVKPGYAFRGWNTNAAGTGTNHSEGASIPVPSGNITLFANWEYAAIRITVTGIPARYFSFEADIWFVEHAYDDYGYFWNDIAGAFPVQIEGATVTFPILCVETVLPFTEPGAHVILLWFNDPQTERSVGYYTIRHINTRGNTIPFSAFSFY
ncbi:MAG: InlB B-repeat-containing protein [Treponema sp.]|nr:InlB B-repeat-containing protein [Treponema sp.]